MIDLSFVVLHVFHLHGPSTSGGSSWLAADDLGLDHDRGFAELHQYVKLVAVVVGLLLSFRSHRAYSALGWAAVFGFALIDDAWLVHEFVGTDLVTAFGLTEFLGLRARDVGELLVWLVAGVVLGLVILLTYLQADEAERRTSRVFAALFVALLACGLVLDMMHIVIGGGYWMDLAFTVAEDGGELAVVSIVVFVVLTRTFVATRSTVPGRL